MVNTLYFHDAYGSKIMTNLFETKTTKKPIALTVLEFLGGTFVIIFLP